MASPMQVFADAGVKAKTKINAAADSVAKELPEDGKVKTAGRILDGAIAKGKETYTGMKTLGKALVKTAGEKITGADVSKGLK